MDEYTVFPRTDCHDRQLYAVVAPNGCALPMRPLEEEEAEHLAETLNRYLKR